MYRGRASKREVILRFSRISKAFGSKTVLKDVNFDIYEGEIFGLIGASGAGKTTLLRTLIGFYSPTTGTILYKGADTTKQLQKIRKIIGFSTQEACFYSDLTTEDNMKFFGKMYGLTGKNLDDKIESLLRLVELWESRKVLAANLSGGMQRRLDLAISMIHQPEILILDEPTSGLDPILRKNIWGLIRKINSLGVTIVLSSHLLDEMEDLCDDVAMIKDGKILVKGSPEQLKQYYSRHQEVWIESYPGNYNRLIQEFKKKGITVLYPRHDGEKLAFYTPDIESVLRVIPIASRNIEEKIKEVRIEKPNLNEVFEALSTYNG